MTLIHALLLVLTSMRFPECQFRLSCFFWPLTFPKLRHVAPTP
jgi:hypothetical protein